HPFSASFIAAWSRAGISPPIAAGIATRAFPRTAVPARTATIRIVFILGLFFGVRRLVAAFHSGPLYPPTPGISIPHRAHPPTPICFNLAHHRDHGYPLPPTSSLASTASTRHGCDSIPGSTGPVKQALSRGLEL